MTSVQGVSLRVLQVNLNHCWTAQQLLAQTILERNVDVVIASDHYRGFDDDPRWFEIVDRKCGVLVTRRSSVLITEKGAGTGFAWAKVSESVFYCCYCTPNCSLQEFDEFLNGLEGSVQCHSARDVRLVIAGDFNAHSAEWGSANVDARGSLLSNLASMLGNVGTVPTFSRVNASSIIDVTFARYPPSTRPLVNNWRVLTDIDSASDHLYIEYTVTVSDREPVVTRVDRSTVTGDWAVKKLSLPALAEYWERVSGALLPLPTTASAEDHAEHLNQFLIDSCNAAMPRRALFKGRKAVHWWSSEIAELRKASIAARRRYQRAGRRADTEGRANAFVEYNEARKKLRLAIRRAQETSWSDLCDNVENDPWGAPYKLVMKKLGHRSPTMDSHAALEIARGLFPELPPVDWSTTPYFVDLVIALDVRNAFNSAPWRRIVDALRNRNFPA
ncbi:uncharacterized protein LOC112679947 [Sipha flava]|uniref:Uncharacterized protein LOC112679947 n=1 Tax=Sipha flava TaxID=143950 RepID=A0A8B8F4W6_9HEMI|nr:uncharacterized protein LOC112679947 [Sipha flava]